MQSLQRHGIRVQEIDGEDPCGLGTQELLPRVARATRRRIDPGGVQDHAGGGRRQGDAELQQLALDPVPLEYSIGQLTCTIASRVVAVMVGWPGAGLGAAG
jgi:hypothetical protein